MRAKADQTAGFPDGELLLTTIAVISYTIFLVLLLNTAVTLDGACLYTFWLPHPNQYVSPYWITVALVSGLVIWALLGLFVNLRAGRTKLWSILYYAAAAVILGWWLYNLAGFRDAMQYERGVISQDQYFDQFEIFLEPHQCHDFE